MLLAIDTATRYSGVALVNADGVQSEISWRSHQNHTVELMPQILHVLRLARIENKDLAAIGVSQGPGSYSGLRVGMSAAKGLAFALKIPILGIPTLDAIAAAHSLQPLPLCVILTAGRGRYSVAQYQSRGGRAIRVSDCMLLDADGLIERFRPAPKAQCVFCGEIDAVLSQKLANELSECALLASPALSAQRAGFLGELAWARFARGESDDVDSLAPMYAPQDGV